MREKVVGVIGVSSRQIVSMQMGCRRVRADCVGLCPTLESFACSSLLCFLSLFTALRKPSLDAVFP